MNLLKYGILLAALAAPVHAASTIDKVITFDQNNNSIIYHNTDVSVSLPLRGWTTDKNSGLDWLDVTATFNMTYDQVNNNSLYSGWRYATRTELDTLLTDSFNINIEPNNFKSIDNGSVSDLPNSPNTTVYRDTTRSDTAVGFSYMHLFDNLISSLGSTLDKSIYNTYGYLTYDEYFQATDPNYGTLYKYYHNTFVEGLLSNDNGNSQSGHIQSNSAFLHFDSRGSDALYDTAYYTSTSNLPTYYGDPINSQFGSFLVRNSNLTPVPLPATVWLVGSALAGFIGFNRRKSMQQSA